MKILIITLTTFGIVFFTIFLFSRLNTQTDPYTSPLSGFSKTISPQPVATKTSNSTSVLISDVPFTAQAPTAHWEDPRQEDGCEEASALMAVRWARGQTLNIQEAEREIIAISDFEQKQYGNFHDTSVSDTITRIFQGYFGYNNAEARYAITINDIKSELQKGNLIIVPANGKKLKNPHYRAPGPAQHMLVIRGYDDTKHEFITNDPGTRFGELYRFDQDIVFDAIYDYSTGFHEPIDNIIKAMIVVHK